MKGHLGSWGSHRGDVPAAPGRILSPLPPSIKSPRSARQTEDRYLPIPEQGCTPLIHAQSWAWTNCREPLLQPIAWVSWCYRRLERIESPSGFCLLCIAEGFFGSLIQILVIFKKETLFVFRGAAHRLPPEWLFLYIVGYTGAFRKGTCVRGCTRLSTSRVATEVTESRMGKTLKAAQNPSVGTRRSGKSSLSLW